MSSNNDKPDDLLEKTGIFTSDTIKVKIDPNYKLPPCLVLLMGPSSELGRQWVLDRSSLVIGRNPTADISIPEPSLSKTHAQIRISGAVVTITDLGSTNKTLINEKAMSPHQPQILKNNDQIRAGNLVFKFLERGILSETHEKARMQSELERAKALQESFLPAEKERAYPGHRISGFHRAATEVSGDWWWHCSQGSSTFVIVGDTTGHGASSALMTSAARSAMATLEANNHVSIDKMYRTLSYAIQSCSGGRFTMSAFLLEIDHADQSLKFINASHLPALILPKKAAGLSWSEMEHLDEPLSPPLGSSDQKISLGLRPPTPDSRIVLFTDGLSERKNTQGQQIKDRTLYQSLIESQIKHTDSAGGFLQSVIGESDQWAQSDRNEDDITIVVIDF